MDDDGWVLLDEIHIELYVRKDLDVSDEQTGEAVADLYRQLSCITDKYTVPGGFLLQIMH